MTTEAVPAVSTRTVSVWDGRLTVNVRVAGTGAPLVFLHSPIGLVWDQLLSRFADHYTVYAPEFPGTSVDDPYMGHVIDTVPDLVLAYQEVIEALGVRTPVLVGHSFGGMLAAELAAAFPSLPAKVVLLAPLGLWSDAAPVTNLAAAAADQVPGLLFHDPTCAAAQMLLTPPDDPAAAVAGAVAMVWALGCTGKFIWPLPDRGLRGRLHRIIAPTLVVWGRQDAIAPVSYADEFTSAIGGARAAVIDDCGHLPQMECFDQAEQSISDFLG
ncbi:MAG TPA: alpha/beta hydrolase [Pseudonocardiaceae bacterium]|nr:alpha/beta hydrolase [Pseudonocardiaceae bacterium]